MKNVTEILAKVIKHDHALNGFQAEDLPDAAKARIQNTLVSLEMDGFTHEELMALEQWTGGEEIFNQAEKECREGGECCYYIYPDGSLYFRSNGDSEVWAFASDFAIDKIINGYDGEIVGMDEELLKHLGGMYARYLYSRNDLFNE